MTIDKIPTSLTDSTGGSMTDAEVKTAYENNADTNAFTDADRTKLDGIATGATANDTDANLKDRANHTGTQTLSTISDAGTLASKGYWSGTQAAYDLLTPDANTIYFITE